MSAPAAGAAVRELLDEARAAVAAWELDETHVVLVTDPETGARHVVGPFPSAVAALTAAETLRRRWLAEHGEPMALFETVLSFTPEQSGV